ncbi:MAG: SprT family zinc-dependent metalloprotease [Alphaproteobacteria bacterium]|nr:SprT family zinc-dependent metalloprotease [Alphaproteobacteria bacterium]
MANLNTDTITVEAPNGDSFTVAVRISGRAKRVGLRIDPGGDGAVLTVPWGAPLKHAIRFAQDQAGWLASNLAKQPRRIRFEHGAVIPMLGREIRVRHCPEQRRGVWIQAGEAPDEASPLPELCVSGDADHLSRRVEDWLKRRAREEISLRARAHARALDRRVAKISIRDTTSRWGSCSSKAGLSFSWRLVLAPEPVLDYVCAHEAAHLVEMNHSPAFWRLVADLVGDWEPHRRWLKRHGGELHRFG